MDSVDETKYLPKRLYFRLTRRESLRIYSFIYLIFNSVFIILGALLMNSVWNTRGYIGDGGMFWSSYLSEKFESKEMAIWSGFSGIFILLLGFLSLMNNLVIIFHIFKGGLRKRLKFAQIFHIVVQSLILVYSIITLAKFKGLITLYPTLFAFAVMNEILGILLFMLIRRVLRRELDYMLPLGLMNKHKYEYYNEYMTHVNNMNIFNPNVLIPKENQAPTIKK